MRLELAAVPSKKLLQTPCINKKGNTIFLFIRLAV